MRSRPFALGTLCYLVLVAITVYLVGSRTHFAQLYCLDDTYIHLAVGKNLLLHHTFGVTPGVFSAVCSSVIWPFLLAVTFAVVGIHSIIPFLIEIALSLIVLYLCQRFLTALQPQAPSLMQYALQVCIVISTSLVMLTFGGMEHVLQIVADLLFLYLVVRTIESPRFAPTALILCAALTTAVRYEGLFLVFISCALLLWNRRFTLSIITGLAALAPVTVMGLYSLSQGSHFLPNSLMIKATNPGQVRFRPAIFGPPLQGILSHYSLKEGLAELFLVAFGVLILSLFAKEFILRTTRNLLIIYCGTCLLHAQFSRLGWVYRYEAYLIALGLFVLFNVGVELYLRFDRFPKGERWLAQLTAAMFVLAGLLLLPRDVGTLRDIPGGAQAVYDQQYQMGEFLAAYYPRAPIAANDIGAITFLNDHDCLDLAGLATVEVTNLKAANQLTTANIRRLAEEHHTRVAVAYPAWFLGESELPPEWTQVGTWTLRPEDRGFLGGDHVTFYAVRPEEVDPLIRNLQAFSSQLPANVRQAGLYRPVLTASTGR